MYPFPRSRSSSLSEREFTVTIFTVLYMLAIILIGSVMCGLSAGMFSAIRQFVNSPYWTLQNKEAKAILKEQKEGDKEAAKARAEAEEAKAEVWKMLHWVVADNIGGLKTFLESKVPKVSQPEQPVQAEPEQPAQTETEQPQQG